MNKFTLEWLGAYEIDELTDFFNKFSKKGGLYIWVHKGSPHRVCYIGETDDFEARFREHFSNAIHGMYTAVDCSNEEDLLEAYHKVVYPERYNCVCQSYQNRAKDKIKFSIKEIEKQIDNIRSGIKLRWKTLKDTKFIFAKILLDGKPLDGKDTKLNSKMRKQVEAFFMDELEKFYKERFNNDSLHWNQFDRKNTNFWGTRSNRQSKESDFSGINPHPKDLFKGLEEGDYSFLQENKH